MNARTSTIAAANVQRHVVLKAADRDRIAALFGGVSKLRLALHAMKSAKKRRLLALVWGIDGPQVSIDEAIRRSHDSVLPSGNEYSMALGQLLLAAVWREQT